MSLRFWFWANVAVFCRWRARRQRSLGAAFCWRRRAVICDARALLAIGVHILPASLLARAEQEHPS